MSVNSENSAVCSLCQKPLSPDNEIIASDPATNGVCGDCKFLLLEDFGSHVAPQSSQRRLRRRFRHDSLDSIENMFNAARQSQSTASAEDDQQVLESWQYGSTHTTPSRSTSWRRALSDTDSDGFDNWSSLYGFYGGGSDVSVDVYSILGAGMLDLPDEGDAFDSDTDIDPMHAGLGQWNTDDMEDDEEEEEDDDEEEEEEEDDDEREWEHTDADEAEARLQVFLTSNPRDNRGRITESEVAQIISNLRTFTDGGSPNLGDAGLSPYGANLGDYLDTRQFEDLLEHLAENDSTRRGAPPASLSIVNNLPHVVISKEHDKHGELVCAICKDVLALGTEASQLPCSHFYHTCCILPWLNSRNSCPLCRYELPTDDKEYEEGKQNNIDGRWVIHERQQLDEVDDSSSDVSVEAEVNEGDTTIQNMMQQREVVSSDSTTDSTTDSSAVRGSRGRWFFLAAAPIFSLVGIVLVLWLGNSQIEGSRHLGGRNLSLQNQHEVHVYTSPDQRESRSRRWWCPF